MINYRIETLKKKAKIDKNIYGHFSEHLGRCIYEGIYVGHQSKIPNIDGMRLDVINALIEMKTPVLRWPGGCFADEYHWKDGIGHKATRKKMINTHWGGTVEDNSFGTHEFMSLCDLVGCEPYINGNVGSGTVQEMSEWVEYMTFDGESPMARLREENGRQAPWRMKYFGVGNENWGCGGNMRPEYYADLYRQFSTYVRNYGDNKVFKVACGPNSDDYHWTEVLMEQACSHMDGLTLHYYTIAGDSWDQKGSATQFSEKTFYKTLEKTLKMEGLITKHSAIMDIYDPQKRVALMVDEWGTWFDVEEGTNPGFLYQQNTMRDALVAGINLNIFNQHADRVRMANIAQVVNVLQAMILTEGERMVLTPTYHVFKMFSDHQNNELLASTIQTKDVGIDGHMVEDLIESASMNEAGDVVITICNLDLLEEKVLDIQLPGYPIKVVEGQVLCAAMNAYNSFEEDHNVTVEKLESLTFSKRGIKATIPPCSVVKMVVSMEQ